MGNFRFFPSLVILTGNNHRAQKVPKQLLDFFRKNTNKNIGKLDKKVSEDFFYLFLEKQTLWRVKRVSTFFLFF